MTSYYVPPSSPPSSCPAAPYAHPVLRRLEDACFSEKRRTSAISTPVHNVARHAVRTALEYQCLHTIRQMPALFFMMPSILLWRRAMYEEEVKEGEAYYQRAAQAKRST